MPRFVLLATSAPERSACHALAPGVAAGLTRVLGFTPGIDVALLDPADPASLRAAIDDAAAAGARELFLLPVALALDLGRRQLVVETVRGTQRAHPALAVYYDDVDCCHPLLLHAFVDAAARALAALPEARPGRVGLVLAASGDGDAAGRADSYRLMRLLWEQLSCARGEVGFVRHERVPLVDQLEECLRLPLDWIVVPQFLWPTEHLEFARVIVSDAGRKHQRGLPLAEPIGAHPNVAAWIEQRALSLFQSRRQRDAVRAPSPRNQQLRASEIVGPTGRRALGELGGRVEPELRYGQGLIADLARPGDLASLLDAYALRRCEQRVFVKVTWHGYATGTYTDPVALDALLAALPSGAVVVEGHSTSRNRGGADWDWERDDARAHRDWIRQQERDYLERTGLSRVLERHGARYLNVTESYWDGECAPADAVEALLAERGVTLRHRELLSYVPRVLFENAGAPFISFARFKGPTRLSISNLFGLLPMPLRSAWHGPNITYFARVCCELARLYGCLFELHGLCESLDVAVKWERRGLYRSRWGNYDLVQRPGLVTLAPDLATADVLASRLQGQAVERSAFFDVVGHELGMPSAAAELPIDAALLERLA